MSELSIEEKAKAYDEAYKKVAVRFGSNVADEIFSQFEMSEDERIRKDITAFFKNFAEHGTWKAIPDVTKWIAWLEKQGAYAISWNENTDDNKPQKNHSVLIKTTHGNAEGEWNGKEWIQYRWSCKIKDSDVLYWMNLSELEKQGEQANFLNKIQIGDKVTRNKDGVLINLSQLNRVAKKNEKQGEKEHVIAPKFNIGDTIRNKITNEVFTITDRCISLEYYHDINHLHEVKFSEQDNWELVVPKSRRMVSAEAKEEILSDELSEFEEAIRDTITTELCNNFGDVSFGVSISSEEAKLIAEKVLPIAEKEIRKKIVDEINAERIADDYIRTRKKEPLFGDGCFERAWLKEGIEITLNKILKG